MKSVENFIEGIKFFIAEQIKKAPFDKSDTAIVVGNSDFGYKIKYNGKIYEDIKTIGGSCQTNETVIITIPQNNLNNMFIIK